MAPTETPVPKHPHNAHASSSSNRLIGNIPATVGLVVGIVFLVTIFFTSLYLRFRKPRKLLGSRRVRGVTFDDEGRYAQMEKQLQEERKNRRRSLRRTRSLSPPLGLPTVLEEPEDVIVLEDKEKEAGFSAAGGGQTNPSHLDGEWEEQIPPPPPYQQEQSPPPPMRRTSSL